MNTRAPLPRPLLHFLLLFTVTFLLLPIINAHDSCCKKHLQPYIPDPSEIPPLFDSHNQPRYVPDPDPDNVRPDDWSEEDDGEWEPIMIENMDYVWTPKLIRNVNYKPNYIKSLKVEITKVIPWILLGILITTLFVTIGTTLLPKSISLRHLLSNAGPIGGATLGLLTPLCSCGSLPVASALAASGVPLSTVVSFLTATQSAGLDSALITWGVLGKDVALIRLGGALILAIMAGLAVSSGGGGGGSIGDADMTKEENGIGSSNNGNTSSNGHNTNNGQTNGSAKKTPTKTNNFLMTAFNTATSNAIDVIPAVCFGLCLSTTITYLLPSLYTTYQSLTSSLETTNTTDATTTDDAKLSFVLDLMAKILVLLSTLPLQLCEHTTVTYAAAIQRSGGSVGLSFGFLLLGPATNVPSLVLLLRQQQQNKDNDGGVLLGGWNPMKVVVVRVAMALVMSALMLTYAVDWLNVDLLVEREAATSGVNTTDLPDWFVNISPYGMSLLIGVSMMRMVVMKWNNKKEHGVSEKEEEECCTAGNGCGNKVKVY